MVWDLAAAHTASPGFHDARTKPAFLGKAKWWWRILVSIVNTKRCWHIPCSVVGRLEALGVAGGHGGVVRGRVGAARGRVGATHCAGRRIHHPTRHAHPTGSLQTWRVPPTMCERGSPRLSRAKQETACAVCAQTHLKRSCCKTHTRQLHSLVGRPGLLTQEGGKSEHESWKMSSPLAAGGTLPEDVRGGIECRPCQGCSLI